MIRPAPHFIASGATESNVSPVRRFIRHFDWILFADVILLTFIGLVMVYSASLRFGNPELYFGKQFTAFVVGFVAMFFMATLNYQVFSQYPKSLFFLSMALLVLVLLVGTSYRGTRAWFSIGPLSFQPSEISKLITILLLGSWCDKNSRAMQQLKTLFVPFLIVACHIVLILLQPDFGSALVYFPVLMGILYVAGARLSHLFTIVFFGIVAVSVLLAHTGFAMSPHLLQERPILDFIYRATNLGKEFLLLQISMGAVLLFSWWFARQLRFRKKTMVKRCDKRAPAT